jgi:hypothetical protein
MAVRPLDPKNVRAFRSRPWETLAKLKQDHWAEAFAADPLSTFFASAAMWEVLHAEGHTANVEERASDFEAHLRLRALLDRAALVRTRVAEDSEGNLVVFGEYTGE